MPGGDINGSKALAFGMAKSHYSGPNIIERLFYDVLRTFHDFHTFSYFLHCSLEL